MKLVRLAVITLAAAPKQALVPSVVASAHADVELTAAGSLPQLGSYAVIAKAYSMIPKLEITPEMEQAAIDILLNKAKWSTWSADRREISARRAGRRRDLERTR